MEKRDLTGAVDFKHLERYAANYQSLVNEVLTIFCDQAAIWVKRMDAAAPLETWRELAHSLKGSALGIGAFALADECEAAERSGATDIAEREELLAFIRTALSAALADIAVYLDERRPRTSQA